MPDLSPELLPLRSPQDRLASENQQDTSDYVSLGWMINLPESLVS